ncbi:7763_t:CDS:2, partial [Racocetra persica]
IFSVENNVSLVDIFISADEIELLELCKQLKKYLLNTESAWKFPKDFITICQHHDSDLYHVAFDLLRLVNTQYKNILPDLSDEILRILDSGRDPRHDLLQKRVSAYPFDSNIIDAKGAALIASWIDKKRGLPYHFKDMPFEFELIYRASQENFSIKKFHVNCDNKGPTVVVIKVLNSKEIIGGYNPLDWRSKNYHDYKYKTSESFIFSLLSFSNGAIPQLSRISTKDEAIVWCNNKGPCFGLQDLWINFYSGSVVGTSKQHSYESRIIDK